MRNDDNGQKHCGKCGRWKALSEFPARGDRREGVGSLCKECHNAWQRKRRKEKKGDLYKGPKSLPPEMAAETADAFELFFNAVTGYILPEHGKTWVDAALNNKRLLLNVPPRHAKTTIMAIWFVIWRFACNRDTQAIIVSRTTKHGQKIARKVADELTLNRKLIDLAGDFKPIDAGRPWRLGEGELEIEGKNPFIRSGDLSLQIRGAGQQIYGMEADWIIADDVTDETVARSESQTEEEWEWFLGPVMTRLAPEGKIFCIGQRVHGNDLYSRLAMLGKDKGKPAWKQIQTPAIDAFGAALWPTVWPTEKLEETREGIGESRWMCLYQQTPEVSGTYVRPVWIFGDGTEDEPGCLDRDRSAGFGWLGSQMFPITRCISVDPSPTMYCGMIVADIIYHPQMESFWCSIVSIRREKMGQQLMMDNILDLKERFSPTALIFESNSVKWLREDVVWNEITRTFDIVVEQKTGMNKNDEAMGVWSLAADFEANRIRLPYGDRESIDQSNFLIDEVLAYPNGRTDDVLMALWFIKYSFRQLIPAWAYTGTFDSPFRPRGAWDHRQIAKEGSWELYA